MLTAKRIIILLFVAVVLYLWIISIFSEKNAPGRGGRYVYSNSLENEKRESDNTFKNSNPPATPPSPAIIEGIRTENPDKTEVNPISEEGGKTPQPETTPPPQPSEMPPEVSQPQPDSPVHVEAPPGQKDDKGNGPPGGQQDKSAQPSPKEEQLRTPVAGVSPSPPTPEPGKTGPVEENKPDTASEPPKISNVEAIKRFDPKAIVLEDYFNQRLNMQIACPKNWTVIQSKTQPEFKCKSDDIEDLFFICRRSRIMEGRKFDEEVDAILKNEIFGKNLQNKAIKTREIGKFKLSRITYDEFEISSNEIKNMKNHLIYIFIESGDEVSMFYFVTPYKLKDKTLPIFEKSIKSIRIIKRPEPAGTNKK